MYLEKAIFVNRAPFDKLELDFKENEIAVLSAVNGRGKTTILSHIVDAFFEMARPYFTNEFEGKENKFYRISSTIHNLNITTPSFVYLRFKTIEGNIDYVDIRNVCTKAQYNETITIEDKIPFDQVQQELKKQQYLRKVSLKFNKDQANKLFLNNILTYFPSYRYEQPGYLNNPYKINLDFKKLSRFLGYLKNPIEVISGLPQLANWIMDIVLDNQYLNVKPEDIKNTLKILRFESEITKDQLPDLINYIIQNTIKQKSEIQKNINAILTNTLVSKKYGNLRFGIGLRGSGGTRLQIVNIENNKQIYPSIFNISSGESSMLCLFGELLRQADNIKNNIQLSEITGIVLIDEIDKHLHIRLQKEVLPKLLKSFPNVQFIVSSHSPFLSIGLAEEVQERSKIIDLDNFGISKDPTTNELYIEVYNMMIGENEKFKEMYEGINAQLETAKILQLVTEGKNTEHIEKAIEILDSSLFNTVKIIKGSENKSGSQQLKNAFDVMSKSKHITKFLFIWDCDSIDLVKKVIETDDFNKYCFENNTKNTKAKKGIENLYSEDLFTPDVYDEKETEIEYGGYKTEKIFNKSRFLSKIKGETSTEVFQKYQPLINLIREILNSTPEVRQTLIEENRDG